jgi:hypothetical protein
MGYTYKKQVPGVCGFPFLGLPFIQLHLTEERQVACRLRQLFALKQKSVIQAGTREAVSDIHHVPATISEAAARFLGLTAGFEREHILLELIPGARSVSICTARRLSRSVLSKIFMLPSSKHFGRFRFQFFSGSLPGIFHFLYSDVHRRPI